MTKSAYIPETIRFLRRTVNKVDGPKSDWDMENHTSSMQDLVSRKEWPFDGDKDDTYYHSNGWGMPTVVVGRDIADRLFLGSVVCPKVCESAHITS